MSVVVFGSVRSCGVTTMASAIAATWPADRRVVLMELDEAGGTLAAASGWPAEPNLVTLAAAGRRDSDPALVWEHCQSLPGGEPVLAGPASPELARSALAMLTWLPGRLDELDSDVLVDCGRLGLQTPDMAVLDSADRIVLATRPRLSDLHALAVWGETRSWERVSLVTVGDGPYPDDEIADALGVEVLGRLPWDSDAAEAVMTLAVTDRQLRLAPLIRSARSLADFLVGAMAGTATVGSPPRKASARESSSVSLSGRAQQLRLLPGRVLRSRRVVPADGSTNGSTPEGATG
jgi:hypothetical protein